ncbi:MAG TPA: FRG domain-containing protein [Anaerolineales bacterium]|jgi:hypothetical protein|nr:FRG domain-containing protein [Anaerolineales bacterium]
MNEFKEIIVRSWEDFVGLVAIYPYGHPTKAKSVFRGHANAAWELVPSFVRHANGLSVREALNLEASAQHEFHKQAAFLISYGMIPNYGDLTGWLALMQHHGVPTRLLDWSRSPFVAAYFAVEEEDEVPGAVWVMDSSIIRHLANIPQLKKYELTSDWEHPEFVTNLFIDPVAEQTLLLATPTRHTDRMFAQQTFSMVSPQILTKHHEVITHWLPELVGTDACTKLIIPAGMKDEFMRQLRKMNLTASSLFPGIDGFGRSVREFILLECKRHYAVTEGKA